MAAQTQIERELVQKQSRCRQVPRRQSDVSDLSAPERSGGLHSDPLAGICTPFRLSAQHADGTVCRYLICGFLPILKYHIRRGFARWWGEKYGENAARPSQSPVATALPEGEPRALPKIETAINASASCLSLWERCLSEAKTERVNRDCQSPLSRLRRQLSQRCESIVECEKR